MYIFSYIFQERELYMYIQFSISLFIFQSGSTLGIYLWCIWLLIFRLAYLEIAVDIIWLRFDSINLQKLVPDLLGFVFLHLLLQPQNPFIIFYGIEMLTLWWPFKTTHILVKFPLFHCVFPVRLGAIIMENKVDGKSKKVCWR